MKKKAIIALMLLCPMMALAGSDTDFSQYHYQPTLAFNTWWGNATMVLQVKDLHNVMTGVEVGVFTKGPNPVLRGMAQYDPDNGVWWLTVHGDETAPMEFHLWDSVTGQEKIADQDWTFQTYGTYGTKADPYLLFWNRPRDLYDNSLRMDAAILKQSELDDDGIWPVLVNLNNPSEKINGVSFDLTLPSCLEIFDDDGLWVYQGSRTSVKKNKKYVFDDPSASLVNGKYHISIAAKNETDCIGDTCGDIIEIDLAPVGEIQDGIYNLTISNILLTKTDGTSVKADDFTVSFILEGIDGSTQPGVELNGSITQAFLDAISADEEILSIDLSGAYLPEGCTFSPANPNALLTVDSSDKAKLTDTHNVIAGGQCDSLALEDGYAFHITEPFTAVKATFTREFTGMGTVCLPFAPQAQGYEFYGLSQETETYLRFTKVDSPEAGVPYIYRKIDGDNRMTATGVDILTGDAGSKGTGGNWKMHGTYTTETFSAIDDVYAISDSKLYHNTGTLTVKPFRAYFTNSSAQKAPSMSLFIDGVTGISEIILWKGSSGAQSYSLWGTAAGPEYRGIVISDGVKTINLQQQ